MHKAKNSKKSCMQKVLPGIVITSLELTIIGLYIVYSRFSNFHFRMSVFGYTDVIQVH